MAKIEPCFHCALPVPANCRLRVEIGGETRPVCCPGCKAVAELVRDSGFGNYYATRDTPQPGIVRPEGDLGQWAVFDRDDMADAFSRGNDARREITIYVGGMYCTACAWLIESALSGVPGVTGVDVSPLVHRVLVRWNPEATGLGGILATIAALGYKPQPIAPDATERPERAEHRAALKRLLVASLGMMQVMMFAVALYSGEFQGIDAAMQRFLRIVSFLVTTPVVLYSARPFFAGAVRGLKAGRPGMDLPVSIAIGAAYIASVIATYANGPAVWFDSVTMFVFFLTLGRYLEMRARHASVERSITLSKRMPVTAIRVHGDTLERVPASRLVAGDRLLVRAGDAVPADGQVVDGTSSVDESVLTGESRPQRKSRGDQVVAASINLDGALTMQVDRTGVDTTLATISRLSELARYVRPDFVQVADRVASFVVLAILLVAAIVAASWYFIDASRAFVVTLSVLVVTCPCALALATPAAFAAAATRLTDLHLLVTNANAIEALTRATHVVFDKTGTLTRGTPQIVRTVVLDSRYDEQDCLRVAAALEAASMHPIAGAFAAHASGAHADATRIEIGAGVSGRVDGEPWRIGSRTFAGQAAPDDRDVGTTRVYLANEDGAVARFEVDDSIREDADKVLKILREMGLKLVLLSGDGAAAVARAARKLGIDDATAACSPADKLAKIRELQQSGATVVMVGDGINDAPVLAGADASIAPSHAATLAQTRADIIMLGDSLLPIVTAILAARQTLRIVRQNLGWAILYNLVAVPLAAGGLVAPWLAAIGMSASSLIVVLNALRLGRFGAGRAATPGIESR